MICTDKKMAQRVAFFGMKKMLTAGTYTLEQGKREGVWWVLSPTAEYLVTLPTQGRPAHCDCPFFRENAAFGVCKHLYFVQNHIKEQDAQTARDAEEDAIADDAEEFMEACRAEHLGGYGF